METYLEKRERLIAGGPGDLHIVADFDGTLACAKVAGQQVHSTMAIIREGGYLNESYVRDSFALADRYRPLEHDARLSPDARAAAMKEWWESHLALKIRHGMHRSIVEQIVADKRVVGKRGIEALFGAAHRHDIPLLIFSAGAGSIIEEFLKGEGLLSPNVHIISNFYAYDAAGAVTGFAGATIHSLNKNEVAIHGTPYAREVAQRRNVLLLGDGLGDACMADGMAHDAIIKVGFLNGDMARRDAFSEKYDLLVPGDDDLSPVVALLQDICCQR